MAAYADPAACASPPTPGRCPYTLVFSPSDPSSFTHNLSSHTKRHLPNHKLDFQPGKFLPAATYDPFDPSHPPLDSSIPPVPLVLAIDLPAPPDLAEQPTSSLTPIQYPSSTDFEESPEITSTTTVDETERETETVTLISTSTATATTTQTRTIAQVASTVTVSLSLPPETITNTVVVTMPPSSLPDTPKPPQATPPPAIPHSSPSAAPSAPAQLPPMEGKKVWTMPRDLEDLGPFKITSYPGDGKNLKIVSGIPPKASITPNQHISPAKASSDVDDDSNTSTDSKSETLYPLTSWSSSTTSLQLFYPEGSINPAQKPKGGEEFYASPLDISTARNVSLRYGVYFPSDFDWVLAGKLPGLYGGHTGCSGGNAALDCFSTRLMWRTGGAGELYLYAAKDKQPAVLCSDPRSECNAKYGFSIGRGSFTWAAGAWTTVVQTVVLNTPGKQDGAFSLDVNGKRVIEKHGVFYRDVLWPSSGTTKGKTTSAGKISSTRSQSATTTKKPTSTKASDPLGDILGPLLSEITHLIRRDGPTPTMSGLRATGTISDVDDTTSPTTAAASEANLLRRSSPTRGGHGGHAPSPVSLPLDDRKANMGQCGEDPRDKCDNGETDDPVDDDENDNDLSFGIRAAAPQREGVSIGFIGLFFRQVHAIPPRSRI